MRAPTTREVERRPTSARKAAILVFAAPVLLGALFLAVAPAPLKVKCTDFHVYFEPLGESIAQGNGHREPNGQVSLAITPGYPVMVAGMIRFAEATGLPREAVYTTFMLLAFGFTSLLLFRVASTLWNPVQAAAASLLWTVYPVAVWTMKLACSEIPFTILILAAVWMLWRQSERNAPSAWLMLAVGIAMGLAMLVRPFGVGLGLVAAAFVLVRFSSRRLPTRLALCLLVLIGNLMTILPWQVYVHRTTGRTILLSSISADTLKLGLTFSAASRTSSAKRDLDLPPDVLALMEDIFQDDSLTSTPALVSRLARELGDRPLAVVKLLLIKAARSLYATHSGDFEGWILAIHGVLLPLLVASALLTWRARPAARWLVILVGLIILYSWAMATLIALPLVRYMVPSLTLGFLLFPELARALAVRLPWAWLAPLRGARSA